MPIRFTKHAEDKFTILKRHKFHVTKKQVIDTTTKPDLVDYARLPLFIAQKAIDETHVLRVFYKVIGEVKIVITFYPGRKSSYEKRR